MTANVSARYDHAACGLLTTDRDGLILEVNETLLGWLGATRDELVGRRRFNDLLSGGGRIYYETHYAPLLVMQGWAREIAFDLVCADGSRLATLVNARLDDIEGQQVVYVAVFSATERRMYERELLIAKEHAEQSEEHARVLARTLQETLLPHDLPMVPGLEIAAVYLPAGAGHEIGGDFYDVFQIARDDWVLALGDVEGKGVEAAVVTALVRYTIRAASIEHEPADVLRIVNDVLLRSKSPRYCTAVILRCRRVGGSWVVTIGSGGHPLPILAGHDEVRPVGRHGSLLGMLDEVDFADVEISLREADLLVAYTDGVTEARQGSTLLGEEVVGEMAKRFIDQPAGSVLDEIVNEALRFGGTPNTDDIAAIAIRIDDQALAI